MSKYTRGFVVGNGFGGAATLACGGGDAESEVNSPQSAMTTRWLVVPALDPTRSTAFTTSRPSTTRPKTTCLPSRYGVGAVQMKNCEPLVCGPALAIDRQPAPVWRPALPEKLSSRNVRP